MSKTSLYTSLMIIYLILSNSTAFAVCNLKGKTAGLDQYSDGVYSFECNVQNLCLGDKFGDSGGWKFNTSKQLVQKHDKTKYPDLRKENKSFDEIKTIYRTTQDNIFECAMLKSKYAAHAQILSDYKPAKKSAEYLKKLNEDIKRKLKENKCLLADESDKVYNSKDVLDSTSYEECVYNMYLTYYQASAQNNLGTIFGEEKGSKKAIDISNESDKLAAAIEKERKITAESLSNTIDGLEGFYKTYVPHTMLQMNYIELNEDKTFMAKIAHSIKQLISLFTGAQKQ